MHDERIMKQILQQKPKCCRARGGPSNKWNVCVCEVRTGLSACGPADWIRLFADKFQWWLL